MKRVFTFLAGLATTALAAPTQLPWSEAGTAAWRKELETREQETAVFPLSPNVILGRTRYGDMKSGVAVLLLDRLPDRNTPLLVARDADCTPRALLRPLTIERGTGTVVCEVTHGTVKPDMEVVLPGSTLKERCLATLPARTPAAPQPAPVPAAPKAGAKH